MKDKPDIQITPDMCPFSVEVVDTSGERYQVEIRAVDILEVVARRLGYDGGLIESTGYLELRRQP